MEVSKFWTKTKIIVLIVILAIIGIVASSVFIYRFSMKKKYMALETKFNNSINNYLKAVGLEIEDNKYIETNIKDVIKKGVFVTDELAKDCEGYVISDKTSNKTYLKCKNIYQTEGYGTKVVTNKKRSDKKPQTEEDTIKPVITLFGSDTVKTSLGKKYKDKGATAKDNIDGDITDKIKVTNNVDTSKEGEYKVIYSVKDKAGNEATKERTVIVVLKEEDNAEDVTPPIITFLYDDTYQKVCLNEKADISATGVYGYTARDDVDGDITSKVKVTVSNKNKKTGTYIIKYSVKDKAGNEATAERRYDVIDCNAVTVTPDPVPDPTPTPDPVPNPVPDPVPDPVPVKPGNPNTNVDSNVTVYPSSIDADDTYYVGVNSSTQIYASVLPSNATDKSLRYTSSDTSIATVTSSGLISGIRRGSTNITITTSNGKSISVYVIVE